MKERNQIVVGILLLLSLGVVSWFVSVWIVRACAKAFAVPNPYKWEWVYVSTSPKAYSFHQNGDCKYLQKTNYDIEFISVDEAEDVGRKPCAYCLENSRRHQYDEAIWYVFTPVLLVLLALIAIIERVAKLYKLRSPFVRKEKYTMCTVEQNTEKLVKQSHNNPNNTRMSEDALNAVCENLALLDCMILTQKTIDKRTTKRIGDIATIMINYGYVKDIDKLVWYLREMSSFEDDEDVSTSYARKVMTMLWGCYFDKK